MAGQPLYSVRTPDGTVYPTVKHAAEALGVKVGRIYWHLHKHGNLDRLGKRTQVTAQFLKHRAKPITVCNVTWESKAELSRWLGFNRDYVKCLLKEPNGSDKLVERVFAKLMETTK